LESEVATKTANLVEANVQLRNSQNKLKLEYDRFVSLIDSLKQGILYLSPKGEIIESNPSIVRMLEVPDQPTSTSQEEISKKLIQLSPIEKLFRECIDTKAIRAGNHHIETYKGQKLYLEFYFVPIVENENLVGVLGCFEDFTDRKKTEDELLLAKEKAEESNRLKTAFLANMSHEIRTPMNGILGFVNLLLNKNISQENQEKYIAIINKSGTRLLNTINDIIDISKIDSNAMTVSSEAVNVSACSNCLTLLMFSARRKGLR
jgi:signal transduction histidine kinase